ncbi:MAG: hypothetical protein KKD38_01670 [Candidatus Delongbacteria bacterium]|nr:hypothetical protein [Candidatus Delongbacteria bacterium]MCG2760619.1 hypothetical protein [Candidatus Delongbacteria bacterium]
MTEREFMNNFRTITADEFRLIGIKLFSNECASKKEYLVWWSPKEEFPALGIGHFIWLPAGKKFPFVEQFPELIAFYLKKREPVPEFILRHKFTGCAWKNREELDSDPQKPAFIEWLYSTMNVQAVFIIFKAMDSINEILDFNPQAKNALNALSLTPEGRFAVVDYLNFKGTGLDKEEQIKDEGWGLLQVLEGMKKHDLENFIISASETLTRRVNNYTDERNDLSFLKGWLKRLESYH